MPKNCTLNLLAGLCAATCAVVHAEDLPLGHKDFVPSPQHPVGWRGDGTGVFPGATPPTEWNGPKGSVVLDGKKVVSAEVPVDWTGPEIKNVLWSVPMPHQTMSSPIVVKGKVITLADPHTILAYDANTGKRLWYNAQDTFDLVHNDPVEAKKMRRLYDLWCRHGTQTQNGDWGRWTDKKKGTSGVDLEAEAIVAQKELTAAGIDPKSNKPIRAWMIWNPFFEKYGLVASTIKDLAATMSTPVSDGESVWVLWSSTHTLACYEVATGKCRWMRWMGPNHYKNLFGLLYNSPILVDDVLLVQHADKLSGLDPATGKDLWEVMLAPTKGGAPPPYLAVRYSCETPLLAEVGGKKVAILWNGAAIEVKTGALLYPGSNPLPDEKECMPRGMSLFLGAPDTFVQMYMGWGKFLARRFTVKGVEAPLWSGVFDPVGGFVGEDTGQSVAYEGYVYANDSDTSALIEVATGKLIPRGIKGPNGGIPGGNVAGKYYFNFDGAASCTVTTLGPEGKLVAINHLIAGYTHTKRLVGSQGHDMSASRGVTKEWWKQVYAARDEGVIGWVGRTWDLAMGEMSGDPFFQGDRIYLRTYTHLICIGGK